MNSEVKTQLNYYLEDEVIIKATIAETDFEIGADGSEESLNDNEGLLAWSDAPRHLFVNKLIYVV